MPRLIKRYGSRKLYDTVASSYVALDELAAAIRAGEHVQVLDNDSGEDVTAAVLTQIISEEGRRGAGSLSTSFLHDLIRIGERISERAARGAGELAHTAGEMVQRLRPAGVAELREELDRLRARLDAIETQGSTADSSPDNTPQP